MIIRNLFDSNRNIERRIEKVITYAGGRSTSQQLLSEISEYVVTDSIEEQMHGLLRDMQGAMEAGGQTEIGVWVSGFYGSGKSSFTKYLGFALDGQTMADGAPFLKHLQDRLKTPQSRALLGTVAKRFPAAVVMLDLATEMVAGATMHEVSTVLYYKVLQWAGYSENVKLASLEQRLEKEGRYDAFKAEAGERLGGIPWEQVHNDPLVMDEIVPALAHQFYPTFYTSPTSFTTTVDETFRLETRRVQEMLDIVRRRSGKDYVIFVVDEVGQYIASRTNLILNLQGLAQNLKNLGQGKAWLIATAQQTLTEDDKRAQFNAPELGRLKDRFPLQLDLESSDIREICHKRLLEKSQAGKTALGTMFDTHGQALRQATKLQDAKFYDSGLERESFIQLYPFLPAHFDILLNLLGALARSTGGFGLRSAIKIVQDILVEREGGRLPVADQEIGWLATTVTLFEALEKDIKRADASLHHAVTQKAFVRFHDRELHKDIARSIAVLQILGNLPVTVENVAALMHPSVTTPSRVDAVRAAVEEMVKDAQVPLTEEDGCLCFVSEKLQGIDQERASLQPRSLERRRIISEALKELFKPLPTARVHNTLTVTSGIKLLSGASATSLAGERETVQLVVEFVDAAQVDAARTRLVDESRQRGSQATIWLLARADPQVNDLVADIYRCEEIANLHRSDVEPEVKEYCSSQVRRTDKLRDEDLARIFKRNLAQGSFIFRGDNTAVAALDQDVLEATRKYLADVAARVYDRYGEAPIRVETDVAEKFLKMGNLKAITSKLDPLGLVELSGGTAAIKTDARPTVSIREFVERQGTVYGKVLLEHFSSPPFGWSQDTVRYLLAAMLVGSQIKLKVSGKVVTVNGPQAVEALKTSRALAVIGISPRDNRPSAEVLGRAAQRLTDLTGESVLPLEDEISRAASRAFTISQRDNAPLAEKLRTLDLPGADRVTSLNDELAEILLSDASDAPQRLGSEDSPIYASLVWAREAGRALDNGLENTVRALKTHANDIAALPDSGIPGQLCKDVEEEVTLVTETLASQDFYQHGPALQTCLTSLKARVRDATVELAARQKERLEEGGEDLRRLPDWQELTNEEQSNALATLEALALEPTSDLAGLRQLVAREFDIQTRLTELKATIMHKGNERRRQRLEDEKPPGSTLLKETVEVAATLTSTEQLEELIGKLRGVKDKAALYPEIEVTMSVRK